MTKLEEGRARRALAGKRVSGYSPYGWDCQADGTLIRNEAEQGWLEWMFQRREHGATYKGIADEMNERGVPTKIDGRWDASTIWKIIHRDRRPSVYLEAA